MSVRDIDPYRIARQLRDIARQFERGQEGLSEVFSAEVARVLRERADEIFRLETADD